MAGLGYQVQHWPLEPLQSHSFDFRDQTNSQGLTITVEEEFTYGLCPEKGLTCTWHVGVPVSIRNLKQQPQ